MNEDSIFLAALHQGSAEARSAFLDQACAGNAELRATIERLLSAHERADQVMHDQAPGLPVTVAPSVRERPGTQIGPYKLLEQIGEGGFGVVFMAEQQQPVRRRVALKVLKPGMDTHQVVARFEQERQALALMDHPHIAKVLDGGTTDSGRPFFVMELIRGVPITEYCDQHQLTPKERLELFVPVCQAVQHAHQKGIIHRDIKPTNVLVTLHDGRPLVKVIDFGVAKATGQQLTEKTLFTAFAQMIGTPLYMSPEQAELTSQDIDTRTDIYALGVLLYELLTGTTPFEKQRFQQVAFDEIRRIIREEEPPRPSLRLQSSHHAPRDVPASVPRGAPSSLATIAALRKMESRALTRLVRGDLDWIVMKCLEKDRNRRYETASGLAMDVERYLADEPVLATPPSTIYRLRKFVRRNRAALTTAVLLSAILLVAVGSIGGTVGWVLQERAGRAARTADEVGLNLDEVDRLSQARQWTDALAALNRAEGRSSAEMLATGLTARLRDARAAVERGLQESHADQRMTTELVEIPLRQSEVKGGHFDSLRADADYAAAFKTYGLDVLRLKVPEAVAQIKSRQIAAELVAALDHWARVRRWRLPSNDAVCLHLLAIARAADPDEMRNEVRTILEVADPKERREAVARLAATKQAASLPPLTATLIASLLIEQKYYDEAVALLSRQQFHHPGNFWINHDLANTLGKLTPPQEQQAVGYFLAALAVRQSPGAYHNLALTYYDLGSVDKAADCYAKAIALDPEYAAPRNNLGIILANQGHYDLAQGHFEVAIRVEPRQWNGYVNLGNLFLLQNKPREAIEPLQIALSLDGKNALAREKLAMAHNNLGNALRHQQQREEAVKHFREAIRINPDSAEPHLNLGATLYELNELDEAAVYLNLAIQKDPEDAVAHSNLGAVLQDQNKLAEAEKELREAICLDAEFAPAHHNLGKLLRAQGKREAALDAFQEAIKQDPSLLDPHDAIGRTLLELGRPGDAAAAYQKAIQRFPDEYFLRHHYGMALQSSGRHAEALVEFEKAAGLKPDFAQAHSGRGTALLGLGRLGEAVSAFRDAIRHDSDEPHYHNQCAMALEMNRQFAEAIHELREVIRLDKKYAPAYNSLAWIRAHCDQAELRDPQEAVSLAKIAVNKHDEQASFWNTLGTAHYRAGDWQAAIGALEKSRQLSDGGGVHDWFFLAMAHWRLGEHEKAAAWFDKAVDWMDKNAKNDEELKRFRAEAEALLMGTP